MPHWWNDLSQLSAWSGPALYLVVFTLVVIESGVPVGFLLPGDTVLFAAGLLTGRPEAGVDTAVMAAVATVGAIAGDALGYETGRRYGRPWLQHRTRGQAGIHRAEEFVRRWGAPSVVVCRFVPWLRTFVPVLAGVGRMRYPAFAAANVMGALGWGAGLVIAGRLAHENATARWAAAGIAATAVAASLALGLVRALTRVRPAPAAERPGQGQGQTGTTSRS